MEQTGDVVRIHVIFARNESTLDEVFAGVAVDATDASQIAEVIEHGDIACWTEMSTLVQASGQATPSERQGVHIVFDGGYSQDWPELGWDPFTSPELMGTFDTLSAASKHTEKLVEASHANARPVHIWSVPLGWYDERLVDSSDHTV